jgi:hypothetical protein
MRESAHTRTITRDESSRFAAHDTHLGVLTVELHQPHVCYDCEYTAL